MKIPLKTPAEIKIMQVNCSRLAAVMSKILAAIKPGVVLADLEKLACEEIKRFGSRPSFKMVPGYHWASCLNLNEGVVHGIPNSRKIAAGDMVSVDLGLFKNGFHSDMSRTVLAGPVIAEKQKFIDAGREVFNEVLEFIRPGNYLGQISQAIESGLHARGFYPVYELTGHGVGRELHEPPSIPGYLTKPVEKTPVLAAGMVLAIEIIYTARSTRLVIAPDNWTIQTADGSWGGLYEDTVLVSQTGSQVLTKIAGLN